MGHHVKFSFNLKLFMHKCPKICLLTEIVKLSKYGKVHKVKLVDILQFYIRSANSATFCEYLTKSPSPSMQLRKLKPFPNILYKLVDPSILIRAIVRITK